MCCPQTVLPRQRLLEHADQQEAILRYIPCEETRAAVRAEWDRRRPDPADDVNLDRWAALKRVCEAVSSIAASAVFCACSCCLIKQQLYAYTEFSYSITYEPRQNLVVSASGDVSGHGDTSRRARRTRGTKERSHGSRRMCGPLPNA